MFGDRKRPNDGLGRSGCQEPLADTYDLPADLLQFAVRLKLNVGSVEYGSDIGVVSFSGGWLHYQGRATEFHLNTDCTWAQYGWMPDGTVGFAVRFYSSDFAGTAILYPITAGGKLSVRPPDPMIELFSSWRQIQCPGQPLLPPCKPHPHRLIVARKKAIRSKRICFGTLILAIFGVLATWIWGGVGNAFVAYLAMSALVYYFVAARCGSAHRLLSHMADRDLSTEEMERELRRVRWAFLFPLDDQRVEIQRPLAHR